MANKNSVQSQMQHKVKSIKLFIWSLDQNIQKMLVKLNNKLHTTKLYNKKRSFKAIRYRIQKKLIMVRYCKVYSKPKGEIAILKL